MIERLQKISAEIFKAALKTYTSKDVLVHKRAHSNSLTEILSLYPNKGTDFFISKKSWKTGLSFQIKRSSFKSYKNGHFYGLKYVKMPTGEVKLMDERPKRLNGLNKRGIWTYSLGNFDNFKTDNGIVYTRKDYEAFMQIRGIGIPKIKSVSEAEEVAQQIQQEQIEQVEEQQANEKN